MDLGLINSRQFLAFKSVKEVPPVAWVYPVSASIAHAAPSLLGPGNAPSAEVPRCFSKKGSFAFTFLLGNI